MSSRKVLYTPSGGADSELCHPAGENGFETIILQVTERWNEKVWNQINFHIKKVDEEKPLRQSDSPW